MHPCMHAGPTAAAAPPALQCAYLRELHAEARLVIIQVAVQVVVDAQVDVLRCCLRLAQAPHHDWVLACQHQHQLQGEQAGRRDEDLMRVEG